MQGNNQKYTKKQLLDSFKKKQNEKIRELIMQETGVDLFSELPQEAVNKQSEQIALDLNEGFFKNTSKKGFMNKNISGSGNNNHFRNDNNSNNKFSNDFKRGPLNTKNQESGEGGHKYGRKPQGGQQQQPSVQKERIPVFEECGFIGDSTIEVWYYKENEEIEGPFNSVDMDNMLFAGKLNYETKIAFKDPEDKYVRIKKLITVTYEDKYNHLFVEPKPVNNDENTTQRRPYYKKEFSGSSDNNPNFSRGVPRFNKQPSDTNNSATGMSRPQFTRTTSDSKSGNPQVASNKPEGSVQVTEPKETSSNEEKNKVKSSAVEEKTKITSNTTASKEEVLPASEQKTQATKKEKKVEEKNTKDTKKVTKETKQEVKPEVETPVVKQTTVVQPPVQKQEDLEGFQTVPSKAGGKKKFDKKNATKILVTGLSEKELQEEENRKRLEEIRQRDLVQQQKYAEQSKPKQVVEVPQQKIDYFDDEEKVEAIIGQEEYFPTLGGNAPAKKSSTQANKNKKQVQAQKQVEEDSDQEEDAWTPATKAGNKLVKNNSSSNKNVTNDKKQTVAPTKQSVDPDWIVTEKASKKKGQKRTQEDSDEEFERQQAFINEQARQEKLKKQKEEQEKQRLYEQQQQDERRRYEEFQRNQQFGNEEYHSESEEEIDPSNTKSFPTLGGSVYTGPAKKNQNQSKAQSKTATQASSKALYNYVKTLEDDSWDVKPKSQPKQVQQKPKTNKLSKEDFPSL